MDLAQSAFGGLAHAVNLDAHLYPKFADRRLRRRLREVGSGQWTQAVANAVGSAASASTEAATRAATEAAMLAAVHASTAAAITAAASPPAGAETLSHHHH